MEWEHDGQEEGVQQIIIEYENEIIINNDINTYAAAQSGSMRHIISVCVVLLVSGVICC
jgi:hypothetical protein